MVGEGQEKALEFTVGRMNKPDVSTSNMPSMNITYKMPFVSTESYSYIYVYTEERELKKVRRKNKKQELNSSALDFCHIFSRTPNISGAWNVKRKRWMRV